MEKTDAKKLAEDWLRRERADLEQKEIWPSHRIVIDRLLKRGVDMAGVYLDLLEKAPYKKCWQAVLRQVFECAASHNPVRMREVRQAIQDEKKLLAKISTKANELADLLIEFSNTREQHSISSPDGFHDPFELIGLAADAGDELSCLYQWHIKDSLQPVRQFGCRYYPDVPRLLTALAAQASNHKPCSDNSFDAAATAFRSTTHADYYRSLLRGFELGAMKHGGYIPDDFQFTDDAMADIINCCFDLDGEVNSGNVKSWRAEVRLRNKKTV